MSSPGTEIEIERRIKKGGQMCSTSFKNNDPRVWFYQTKRGLWEYQRIYKRFGKVQNTTFRTITPLTGKDKVKVEESLYNQ